MIAPIGHSNYVETSRVLVILNPSGSQARKVRQAATDSGLLINATSGNKARSIIVMDTSHVVLSALQPQTLKQRLENRKTTTGGPDAGSGKNLLGRDDFFLRTGDF